MITAGNTIAGAARIALARPELADRILREIFEVEKARYQTDECLNIACGEAIDAFSQIFHLVQDKKAIMKFMKKQLNNSRAAVRKRAEKFLWKHQV